MKVVRLLVFTIIIILSLGIVPFAVGAQATQGISPADASNVAAGQQAIGSNQGQTAESSASIPQSPGAIIGEMIRIDTKILAIKETYLKKLTDVVVSISKKTETKFSVAMNAEKDEFESEQEFADRVQKMKDEASVEQTKLIEDASAGIEESYKKEIVPLIESLKKLSGREITLIADALNLELGIYNAEHDVYPISINGKSDYQGVLVACSADVPIPREEARRLKSNYEQNVVKAMIVGNFQTTKFFRVAEAYVVDDVTNKKYDLFTSKFVDIGNGVVYDSETKLLWLKNANTFTSEMNFPDAVKAVSNLKIADLSGWRLPSQVELTRMYTVAHDQELHPFINIIKKHSYWTNIPCQVGYRAGDINDHIIVNLDERSSYCNPWENASFLIWPVRGESSLQ
jgi:hypothetical protein